MKKSGWFVSVLFFSPLLSFILARLWWAKNIRLLGPAVVWEIGVLPLFLHAIATAKGWIIPRTTTTAPVGKTIDISLRANIKKSFFVLPLLPFFLLYIPWDRIVFRIWDAELEHDLPKTLIACFLPVVICAYILGATEHQSISLLIAVESAFFTFIRCAFGLKLKGGVLGWYGELKLQASPAFVGACALVFALSFGCIHYDVQGLWAYEYGHMDGWQDSVYFSVVTLATVGYGDITPNGHIARWLSVVEIVLGFVLLVIAVNASLSVWLQTKQPTSTTNELHKN